MNTGIVATILFIFFTGLAAGGVVYEIGFMAIFFSMLAAASWAVSFAAAICTLK